MSGAAPPPDAPHATMRRLSEWRPTKFRLTGSGWRSSSDARHVGVGSRHAGDLQAGAYAAALRTHARGRLLDLGCGEVPLYEMYRPYVASAVCVDWPRSFHGLSHLDVACDLNRPLPFAAGSFETVLMSDVLEHIYEQRVVWSEIARVLRGGGRLILGVPFLYWLHEEPYDYFRPTEYALRRACAEHALSVLSLTPYGGAADVLCDIAAKHLAAAPPLARGWYWAGRAVLPAARRLLARTGRKFPLGYLLVAESAGGGTP
jgi:SAM-dependent methyltransferase